MRKWIAFGTGLVFTLGGLALSSPAVAADYTKYEERAWKSLKKNKKAKPGRKAVGKFETIRMMNNVCFRMDNDETWEEISDWWIGISLTANNRKEQDDFIAYGPAVSYGAVYNLCPWHMVDVQRYIDRRP